MPQFALRHSYDPAGIGSAPQNPELGSEPFTNRTQADASVRIRAGLKTKKNHISVRLFVIPLGFTPSVIISVCNILEWL